MTTPVVNDGQLKLIGMIPSPWPCFCVAANESVLALRGNEINELIRVVLKEGRRLNRDADNVVELLGRLHKVKEIAEKKRRKKEEEFFFLIIVSSFPLLWLVSGLAPQFTRNRIHFQTQLKSKSWPTFPNESFFPCFFFFFLLLFFKFKQSGKRNAS